MSAIAGHQHDVLTITEAWQREGRALALATVAETWGSAPRPVGSHLIIDSDGNFEGSVSGGCVEGAVVVEAEEAIRDGKPRFLTFGVADETAWNVGLSCGGRISVLVQPLAETEGNAATLIAALNEARSGRRPVLLASDIETGRSQLVGDDDKADPALMDRLRQGSSGIVELGAAKLMATVYVPPPRLVLLGAVHISQALAPMAASAGFDVSVVDPRTAFATEERFRGVRFLPEWPQDALPKTGLDRFTAFAALTHDPKIDDPGLTAALEAQCFYVGALGSRKTHGKRLERLREAGVGKPALNRIHAPIGLAIGARSPAEIAVAVLAEIIEAKNTSGTLAEAAA